MIQKEQVDQVRAIARQYSGLDNLTRLPDSMAPGTPCQVVDTIRSLAIAYVVNETLDRSIREDESGVEVKQRLSISGPLVSPYRDIPVMEFDPTDLVGTSW